MMVITGNPSPVILDRENDVEVRPLGAARDCGSPRNRARHDALWRIAAAEAFGTALLVALTCLPGCERNDQPLVQRALAGGLVVAALVQCFDHISGAHFNPTVTLAALLARRIGAAHAAAALVAQVMGALVGSAALWALSPHALGRCVTKPTYEVVTIYQALCIEGTLGAVLALVNLSSWDVRNSSYKDSWPLRIGFTVAAMTFAAGDLTGASMNPVRSFGPAALAGQLVELWVYMVGPLCGSALAAALYACTWRMAPPAPPRAPPHPHDTHKI